MRHRVYGPLGDPKYEGYADDIQRSGKLLLDLINDLLDATKLESGHYELAESECDLKALLEEAAGLVKLQAERAEVCVKVAVNGFLPPVLADQRALRQILLNLLSNRRQVHAGQRHGASHRRLRRRLPGDHRRRTPVAASRPTR